MVVEGFSNFQGAYSVFNSPNGPIRKKNPNLKVLISIGGWCFTLALLEDNTLIKWVQGRGKSRNFNKLHADLNEGEEFTKFGGGQGFSMALTTQSRVFYRVHTAGHGDEVDGIVRESTETFYPVTSLESFTLNREERPHQLVCFPNSASAITHLNVHFLKFGLMTADGDVWLGQYINDPVPLVQLNNTHHESLQHQGVCQVSFG